MTRPLLCLAALACVDAPPTAPTYAPPTVALALATAPLTTVSYGTHPRQRIDLWPASPTCADPQTVIWIHGGQWINNTQALPSSDPVLRLRFRCLSVASVDFRQSQDSTWPAQIRDVKAAVRWLRANGAAYGLGTVNVGVWGHSSGAHLASILATSCGDPWTGNGTPDECVQAVVMWSTPVDFSTEDVQLVSLGCKPRASLPGSAEERLLGAPVNASALLPSANPLSYPTRPPARIAAGTLDCSIPYLQSQTLANGWPGATLTLLAAGHGRGGMWDTDAVVRPTLDFLDTTLHTK